MGQILAAACDHCDLKVRIRVGVLMHASETNYQAALCDSCKNVTTVDCAATPMRCSNCFGKNVVLVGVETRISKDILPSIEELRKEAARREREFSEMRSSRGPREEWIRQIREEWEARWREFIDQPGQDPQMIEIARQAIAEGPDDLDEPDVDDYWDYVGVDGPESWIARQMEFARAEADLPENGRHRCPRCREGGLVFRSVARID